MPEREKVIKGLECCAECGKCKSECPYAGKNNSMYGCTTRLAKDALALLKEQEPVKPSFRKCIIFCGHCGDRFPKDTTHYCTNCGRAVKWNDQGSGHQNSGPV